MQDVPDRMNESPTRGPIEAGSTQPRSAFDPVDIRRGLIARRVREGATSEDGYTCSNLVEPATSGRNGRRTSGRRCPG